MKSAGAMTIKRGGRSVDQASAGGGDRQRIGSRRRRGRGGDRERRCPRSGDRRRTERAGSAGRQPTYGEGHHSAKSVRGGGDCRVRRGGALRHGLRSGQRCQREISRGKPYNGPRSKPCFTSAADNARLYNCRSSIWPPENDEVPGARTHSNRISCQTSPCCCY